MPPIATLVENQTTSFSKASFALTLTLLHEYGFHFRFDIDELDEKVSSVNLRNFSQFPRYAKMKQRDESP